MDAGGNEAPFLPPILERACEEDEEPVNAAHISTLVDATDGVQDGDSSANKDHSSSFIHNKTTQPNKRVSKLGIVTGTVTAEVDSFFAVFGRLGVAMVVVFTLSALWTFMLAFIQVYTNDMANAIMSTTHFDNGQFWMLAQVETPVVVSSVVLLFLFGIGYLWLVVYMLFGRQWFTTNSTTTANHAASKPGHAQGLQLAKQSLRALKSRFTHPTPLERHYLNAALDLPKLIFQATTLITYLRRGFPTSLIFFYSVLLLANWLVACYRYQRFHVDPRLVLSRQFYMFDLFFAVFSPLVVLVYFVYNFEFDRNTFRVREETLPKGSFDRIARLFGNPAQITGFCSAFHYLQLTNGSSIFYKSALNALSLYKWTKIIYTLFHTQRNSIQDTPTKDSKFQKVKPRNEELREEETAVPSEIKKYHLHQRDLPKLFVAGIFLFAGIAVFVYSVVAVDSTHKLCHKYSRCGISSYKWNVGNQHCTCLMFVDRQLAPTTFEEWNNPVDTTANLEELAYAGELRIIQIINRAVPVLPDSVRKCQNLEQLILIYSKTEVLPDWVSEFSSLEYLHYEGDFTNRRLKALPDGMFDNYRHMTFLHLGSISKVPRIPSLMSLSQLQYLAIAGGFSLSELPSFDGLVRLKTLILVDMTHVPTLPSFSHLKHLKAISLRYRSAVCCNGFLFGECDLTQFSCSPKPDESVVQCTDARISAADNATLRTFGGSYCNKTATIDLTKLAPTQLTTDEACGSIMYKQCQVNGKPGICFNSRMQVINCVTVPDYINMRRLEIARGVGPACDPAIEQWLGCSTS